MTPVEGGVARRAHVELRTPVLAGTMISNFLGGRLMFPRISRPTCPLHCAVPLGLPFPVTAACAAPVAMPYSPGGCALRTRCAV